jgi:hypothetical protein
MARQRFHTNHCYLIKKLHLVNLNLNLTKPCVEKKGKILEIEEITCRLYTCTALGSAPAVLLALLRQCGVCRRRGLVGSREGDEATTTAAQGQRDDDESRAAAASTQPAASWRSQNVKPPDSRPVAVARQAVSA